MAATARALNEADRPELQAIGRRLDAGLKAWEDATDWVLANAKTGVAGVLTAAVPYLDLAVAVTGGWLMGKAALAAAGYLDRGEGDQAFYTAKLASAGFYAEQSLPLAQARVVSVLAGDGGIAGLGGEALFG